MPSVAFLGSHPLGERCLDQLTSHDAFSVELVVTYGPGEDTWWDGCLYDRAERMGHRVVTRDSVRAVLDYDVDYLVSVYYPDVLDAELLAHPNVAPLNLHQAELPRYRGQYAFSHAIMNARADDHWRYGTTLHVMAPEVETGDIVARRFVPIAESDTARTLYDRVCDASVELFREQLTTLRDGAVRRVATPQSAYNGERYGDTGERLDVSKAIPVERLADDDEATQLAVYDKIRALDFPPFEPAYTELGGRRVYLTATNYGDIFGRTAVGDIDDETGRIAVPQPDGRH
ncbi:formyltransferase family protein [Haloarcula laminariae]|uniref:formyltransferase family protein n=1 Tax=Haloarcula laminariae TaxID=2961577 RepID=UPI0021C96126|nr:formyltransferase family protein [Halomicroarcula laminariae]